METMKKFKLACNHGKLAIVLMVMTLLLISAAAKGRFGGGSSGIQPQAQPISYNPYFPYIPIFRSSSKLQTLPISKAMDLPWVHGALQQ